MNDAATHDAASTLTRRQRLSARHLAAHVAIVALGLVMLYPVLWMVSSAFKPPQLIFTEPGLWPRQITFENWALGWMGLGIPFSRFFFNSTVIAGLSVLGNLCSCSIAAYAFARLEFHLKPLLFALMLGTIMLPFQVVMVPQYILFQGLGWTNTPLPLIVPKFLAVDAFFVFLLVQFIRGLPRELDDAATVDGCGPLGVFWRIIFPLLRPALAVTAVFTFIWSWNDFLGPLIYLTATDNYTVSIALNAFLDSTGTSNWGAMFAMSVLSLVPLFLVFVFAQKQLVQGIATTGLK
ncbi:MAG: carbohydrate ABC transporter permease [Chloroflexi bacterium]|nr:carbohydrate ABC transporter permease [Chloroflexota bacterium]